MFRIGLLSDTHGWLDEKLLEHFAGVDEIWHAGDIGHRSVADQLQAFKPLQAVRGNIDDAELRRRFPEEIRTERAGVSIWMIHIGGYPGRYSPAVRAWLNKANHNPANEDQCLPDLFICGHSHILRVERDPRYGMLCVNPGAAGKHGFHQERTALRMELDQGKVAKLELIKLGLRGALR